MAREDSSADNRSPDAIESYLESREVELLKSIIQMSELRTKTLYKYITMMRNVLRSASPNENVDAAYRQLIRVANQCFTPPDSDPLSDDYFEKSEGVTVGQYETEGRVKFGPYPLDGIVIYTIREDLQRFFPPHYRISINRHDSSTGSALIHVQSPEAAQNYWQEFPGPTREYIFKETLIEKNLFVPEFHVSDRGAHLQLFETREAAQSFLSDIEPTLKRKCDRHGIDYNGATIGKEYTYHEWETPLPEKYFFIRIEY